MASKKYTWVAAIALVITRGGTTAAHADPDKVAYELAERCGQRAEKVFNTQNNSGISTYESHYNAKLNGCFAVTWVFTGRIKLWELWDVNENRRLAVTECRRRPGVAHPADDCTGDIQTPPVRDITFRAALQRYMER